MVNYQLIEMATYDTGYDDERFLHPVGHTLHCGICTNVLKDPVMCGQNEHLFCRVCITMHLKNSQTCPNCIEPLTIATLSQASRGIRNLLAELKIKCEFFDRGCGKFIELEHLERHVADCGFVPVVCSNEGCHLEVSKRDLLHHETAVCELRRVKCHSCNDIKQEVDTLNVKLSKIDEKVEKNVARVEQVQAHLVEQDEMNRQLKTDNEEMKKSLNEVTIQLDKITRTLLEVRGEQMRKIIAEDDKLVTEPNVVILGGSSESESLKSVEMFKLSNGTWSQLQPLKKGFQAASSSTYKDQGFVIGGYVSRGGTKSIKKFSLNAIRVAQHTLWEDFPGKLHASLHGHCSVVYDRRLILIGGYDDDKEAYSDDISQVSLVPPYTSKLLASMPQTRWYHSVALFDDKIVIFGGTQGQHYTTNLASVLMYDITKNEFQELAPLPYAVSELATVRWGDDNVIIAGGVDKKDKALNKVLMYNIKTQKGHELPEMNCKRKGCVAAVVGDTVMVMGGKDERGNVLKSVEGFKFDRYSWQELPEMHERRYVATAIVC